MKINGYAVLESFVVDGETFYMIRVNRIMTNGVRHFTQPSYIVAKKTDDGYRCVFGKNESFWQNKANVKKWFKQHKRRK